MLDNSTQAIWACVTGEHHLFGRIEVNKKVWFYQQLFRPIKGWAALLEPRDFLQQLVKGGQLGWQIRKEPATVIQEAQIALDLWQISCFSSNYTEKNSSLLVCVLYIIHQEIAG